MIKIKTLENTDHAKILDCFNESFSDYSIPLRLTVDQLTSKILSENIELKYSVGSFKGDKLIGLILHGTKEVGNSKLAYNGGTGVVPDERRQKLTVRMYEHITPILQSDGFGAVKLEVISNNVPAIKSYSNIGFKLIRKLNCYRGEIQIEDINPEVNIQLIENPDIRLLSNIGEVNPTWQNSPESVSRSGKLIEFLGAYVSDKLCGYALLKKQNSRLVQIAVDKDMRRRKIGSTLLNYIQLHYSDNTSITNVDADENSINQFLEKCNLTNFLQQNEMNLSIEVK